MIILPFIEESYIKDTFAQLRISISQLDYKRKQSFEEFRQVLRPEITYGSEDCLILISDTTFNLLQSQKWIDLSLVEQIGWYSEDHHAISERLLKSLDPQRFDNLYKQNSSLKIANFELLRDPQKILKQVNILTGGIGLCYYHFRADYDSFFSRMEIGDDSWSLPRNQINVNTDITILSQLFLLEPSAFLKVGKKIFDGNPSYEVLHTIYKSSFDFFLAQKFNVTEYFQKIENDFGNQTDKKDIVKNIKQLYENYFLKGLGNFKTDKLTSAIKSFIDLAKNDIPELSEVLKQNKEISKTSLFLVGMLHRADHIEKQFGFGNFIPAFVELFSSAVGEFVLTADDLIIRFKKSVLQDKQIQKLNLLNRYLIEIKKCSEIDKDIEILQRYSNRKLKESEITLLDRTIHELDSEISAREFALKVETENRVLGDNLKQKEMEIVLLRRDIDALKGGKTELAAELENKNRELGNLNAKIQKLSYDIEGNQKEIAENKLAIKQYKDTISDLTEDLTQKKINVNELSVKLEKLNADLEYKNQLFAKLSIQHRNIIIESFSRKHFWLKLFRPKEFKKKLDSTLEKAFYEFSS